MSSPPSSVSHPFLTAKWGVEEAGVLYFSFSIALRWEIEIIKQTPRKKTRCWENEPSNYKQTSKCSLRGRYYYKGTEQVQNSHGLCFWDLGECRAEEA